MNFFSVLGDSDNEDEKKVVPQKKGDAKGAAAPAKGAAAPAAKKDAAPAKKDAAPAAKKDDKPKSKDAAAPANGGKPKEARVSHSAQNAAETERDAAKDDNRAGKGRDGKDHRRGQERGPRGEKRSEPEAIAGERRPKREFDRRSGTGRGKEVAKGGRGAFGAGNPTQDAQEAEKDPNAVVDALPETEGEAAAEATEEVAEEPVEEEPPKITMEQFLAEREASRQKAMAALGDVKERTVDRSKEFAGMSALNVALDDYLTSTKKTGSADTHKDQRSTGKNTLDLAFKFPTPGAGREDRPPREFNNRERSGEGRGERREGGRGGRGEGRGRGEFRGRGEGRGDGRGRAPRSGGAAFNAADFPSL